ncbi:ABATE domain-containing protein [Planomonospora sp. ID67723]|uniref:CGNR zinc finger domain-containing protein n=1 Tax=Planomonospora sp. ID67723 TaxID=2738134 RepID=UPI0018C37214|nr:ABATE domain-containing protein [Planomonospora sp. ID67723]MBG0829229.1 ABATE domain-containing protein [Planomonospora sp. ID67723]
MSTFRFHSGRHCLNLIATVGRRRAERVERLTTPADLGRWFTEAGLAASAPAAGARELRQARALRESMYELFTACLLGGEIPSAELAAVNDWAARPAPAHRLEAGPDGRLRRVPGEVTAQALLAEIARDAVDLLGGPLAERVHECELGPCTVLFLDTSRSGRRRWCSMDGCGARAKMAAYRARRTGEGSV